MIRNNKYTLTLLFLGLFFYFVSNGLAIPRFFPEKPTFSAQKPCPPMKPGRISKTFIDGKLTVTRHPSVRTQPCHATGDLINLLLGEPDEAMIHNLLSQEMLANFTPEQIIDALKNGNSSFGEITEITPLGAITQNETWAEQEVVVTTSQGFSQTYTLILHLEDGEWKIWGSNVL